MDHNSVFDAAGGRKARILVVDDNDNNREIVEAYLSDSGYRVDTIDNATEAIRLLQKERYDLVLMDIQMPVMDGVTATRRIRALPNAVKDIPIIAMTANVLPQQVRSFLDAGMNAHVGKPFDRSKLRNSVRRWLPSTEGREESGAHSSPLSEVMKYEELVGTLPDLSGTAQVAAKFVDQFSDANKFTPQNP